LNKESEKSKRKEFDECIRNKLGNFLILPLPDTQPKYTGDFDYDDRDDDAEVP